MAGSITRLIPDVMAIMPAAVAICIHIMVSVYIFRKSHVLFQSQDIVAVGVVKVIKDFEHIPRNDGFKMRQKAISGSNR